MGAVPSICGFRIPDKFRPASAASHYHTYNQCAVAAPLDESRSIACVQTPAGMPAPEGRSIVNRKLGLLNVCAVCENLPPSDVALIALAACDDSSSEVCTHATCHCCPSAHHLQSYAFTIGAGTLIIHSTVLYCSIYWSMIAHVWPTTTECVMSVSSSLGEESGI